MKKILLVFALISTVFLTSCGVKDTSYGTIENITYEETTKITNYAKIEMNNSDIILIELYPDIAPITVENFQKLISEKYYDGLIFHRVIENFMIQTGDPTGTGTGGSDETIKGEFLLNGVVNELKHERGILSMARKGTGNDETDTEEYLNSASSQFFIVHQTSEYLDTRYAAFGKVIAGMDVVDKIATQTVDNNDKPLKTQKIKSIRFIEISDEFKDESK